MSNSIIGKCPVCGTGDINEELSYFYCDGCNFRISRSMSGHIMCHEEVEDLILTGRTGLMSFTSRNNKKFKAYLVLKDKKIVYEFDNSAKQQEAKASPNGTPNMSASPGRIDIRVEAFSSGSVSIQVVCTGKSIFREISYGNISARESECLASITAVNLVHWLLKDVDEYDIHLSVNNIDFAGYLLREARPKDSYMRFLVNHLWERLSLFRSWQASYLYRKRRRLEGSNSGRFPKGVFPYIDCSTGIIGNTMSIRLNQSPEILTQFKASFPNASLEDLDTEKLYYLPSGASKAVETWVQTVSDMNS